ncbi:MAG TPA: hypothetical protein VMO17_22115 [Terriglobia bacterium]|nr:hypothetical protein [Terriglobia bacterium]
MATIVSAGQNIQKQFEQAGFEAAVVQSGKLELKKSGCVAYLENKGGDWIYLGPPYLTLQGADYELEDRGYQKFWYRKTDNRRVPIRRVELETLHRFDEEIRYILGLKSLYNESLGSTNARTVYDRLTGRPDR